MTSRRRGDQARGRGADDELIGLAAPAQAAHPDRRGRLTAARAAGSTGQGGPLHGVPIGLEDVFDAAGIRTTYGFSDQDRPAAGDFDASDLGYRVVVLADPRRGTNPEMEAAALRLVSLHLGLVMDAADLLAEWRSA